MYPLLAIFTDHAVFFLRVVLGFVLAAHGWPKISNLRSTMANFAGIGFRPGWLWGTVAAVVESAGGLALVLGLGVRYVALVVILEFLVVVGWRLVKRHAFIGALELDLLILAAALVLSTFGGGVWSADNFLKYGSF